MIENEDSNAYKIKKYWKNNTYKLNGKKIVKLYLGDDYMKLLPFNDIDLKTPKILETLNNASRSLAELKGFANSIPNNIF